MKKAELRKRRALKEESAEKFREAKEKNDIENMRKYATRSSMLTQEMIGESKKLLEALGIPWVDAPCEGRSSGSSHGFQRRMLCCSKPRCRLPFIPITYFVEKFFNNRQKKNAGGGS